MPFGGLMSRISELSLSELNHNLGKAKESLMYGSSQYVQNFRTDAAQVGTMIRSESTKFGDYLKPKMPKSTSLPVIQDPQHLGSFGHNGSGISHKYQYRSRTYGDNFSPTISPTDLLEESVVAKFIKVVGEDIDDSSSSRGKNKPKEKRRPTVHTREDILKKLTDFGDDNSEDDNVKEKDDDLEICFINEKAFDDTEEVEEEEEDVNTSIVNTTNILLESDDIEYKEEEGEEIPYSSTKQFELEKRRIKGSACQALAQCQQIARSQVMQEKQNRTSICKIKAIIGMDYSELNEHCLREMNFSSLQVILNDMADSVELYNKELVHLLISKDELQIEQESMLMDIGDILQNH